MTAAPLVPELIRRYFELAPKPDQEEYFALFADDAVVQDESKEYRGIEAIRNWRRQVPLVTYTITDVEDTPDGTIVTTTISGDFAGSPFAGLKYRFRHYDSNQIRQLTIAP